MAIDSRYIPAFSIEDVMLDKDTGAPLSGGLVYFEQDNQRGVLKPVYQITGTSPNYQYTQLPNPMTLSSIGTFQDSLGNPIIPYFLPYDSSFNVEYYYVRVTSSDDVFQFDREAVPYVNVQGSNEVLSVISNEISNPQFSQVLFDTSNGDYVYNFSAAINQEVSIAPDWDLVVTCPTTGTVTVNQLTPTGAQNLATNPGTILNISSAGITQLLLRQRLYGSPNLWGSGYLSATFTAKTYSGTSVTLNMYYDQSNGSVTDVLLATGTLPPTGNYETISGSALIPVSTSTQSFPNSYVDIYFDIPLSIEIDITSVMVAFTNQTNINNIVYDQVSNERQIDHLYHYAYPIVPIGAVIDVGGFTVPEHYLLCDGAAYNRIQYLQLFQTLTTTESVALTSGSANFTVVSAAKYRIGMPIEGAGIQATSTITNIVGTTITMSLTANLSVTSTVRFFAAGAGNGVDTFNVYDLRDYVVAGSGGTLLGGVASTKGGAATVTLAANQIAPHTHSATSSSPSGVNVSGATNVMALAQTNTFTYTGVAVTVNANVPSPSQQPVSVVQQTALLMKCIRYE